MQIIPRLRHGTESRWDFYKIRIFSGFRFRDPARSIYKIPFSIPENFISPDPNYTQQNLKKKRLKRKIKKER